MLVEHVLPRDLKRILIFEDFNECVRRVFKTNMTMDGVELPWEVTPAGDLQAAAAFAARSVSLERLSVAYMISAKHFFASAAGNPSWTWPDLKSLALTSPLLRETPQNADRINCLLQAAGITALRMPKLQTLTLWSAARGKAWAFIYQRGGGDGDGGNDGASSITWRGT